MSPSQFRRLNRIFILLIVFFPVVAIVVGVFNSESNIVLFASVLIFYALVNLSKHFLTKAYLRNNTSVSCELQPKHITSLIFSSVLLFIFVLYFIFNPFNASEFLSCSIALILIITVQIKVRNYEYHIDEQGIELEAYDKMSLNWEEVSKIEIINSELRLTINEVIKVFEIQISQIERLKKILKSANQEFFLSE